MAAALLAGDGLTAAADPRAVAAWAALALVAAVDRSRPFALPTRRVFLIDVAWVSMAYAFNVWSVIVWPPSHDGDPAAAPGLVASMPFVLALAAFVACSLSAVIDPSPRMLLASGATLLAAIGQVARSTADHRGPDLAMAGSNGWVLGWVALFVVASMRPDRVTPGVVRTTLQRQLFIYVPVGVALLVSTIQNVVGDRPGYAAVTVIGVLVSVVFVVREIVGWAHTADLLDERQRVADQMRWSATHDELTGLLNRAELTSALDAEGVRSPLSVLFIDLDHFKVINDSLGHVAGDRVLCTTASRIASVTGPTDILARFGGDEFVVVLTDEPGRASAVEVADQIRTAISTPIPVGGASLVVTASIGVTEASPGAGSTELLRDADTAMYRAKALGRDRVDSMHPQDHLASVRRLEVTADLRRALDAREFVAHFQPIIDLGTRRLTGFEALARWTHPQQGTLAPARFIDVAEETGLIAELSDQVLRDALGRVARWVHERPDLSLSISVNASVRQLVTDRYADEVAAALRDTGVDPERLWLEITETALMTDTSVAAANAQQLRARGVGLSVDDFGTGYASLTYLQRLPIGAVKIDRSFVAGLGRKRSDEAIASAVISLSHSLGLTVVAEGIEHEHQAAWLGARGCHRGQGYLFDRPLDAAAATDLVRRS